MSRFLDARFAGLAPYTPGEQPQGGGVVKLNTNESPYPPSSLVIDAVEREVEYLNLYPDPGCRRTVAALAAAKGLEEEQVFLGNGSDEILAFTFQALCPNGAAFADLTYGFYEVYCHLYGVDCKRIPVAEDFSIAPGDYAALGRTIFIANPNSPTGLALRREEIREILTWNSEDLVVIDEAYVAFGAESALPLLAEHPNLLIVGTFSKSHSLAGGRLGYAFGSRELIEDLNRIKFSFNPYNVNRLTLAAGAAAIEDQEYFGACTQAIVETRAEAVAELDALGFTGTDSLANFLFVTHKEKPAQKIYEALAKKKVLVRWFDQPRLANRLRITIGAPDQMKALYKALREVL